MRICDKYVTQPKRIVNQRAIILTAFAHNLC